MRNPNGKFRFKTSRAGYFHPARCNFFLLCIRLETSYGLGCNRQSCLSICEITEVRYLCFSGGIVQRIESKTSGVYEILKFSYLVLIIIRNQCCRAGIA